MNTSLKEIVIKNIQSIERDGIDKLLNWLQNKSDYFEAPGSTKYHSNFKGGLLEHSHNVYEQFKNKCDFWKKEKPDLYIPDENTIKICGYLHDICKCNIYVKGSRNVKNETTGKWEKKQVWEVDDSFPVGHGDKSVIQLQSFIKLTKYEIYAIRWHMGQPKEFIEEMTYNKALETYPSIILLHTADYESSYLLEKTEK